MVSQSQDPSQPLAPHAHDMHSRPTRYPPNLILYECDDPSNSIPLFDLGSIAESLEPVSFAEANFVQGAVNGGIKVKLPTSLVALFDSTLLLDPDTFTFIPTSQNVTSPHFDIRKRIRFHNELVTYFTNDESLLQECSDDHTVIASENNTSALAASYAIVNHFTKGGGSVLDSSSVKSRSPSEGPWPSSDSSKMQIPSSTDAEFPQSVHDSNSSDAQGQMGSQTKLVPLNPPEPQAHHVSDEQPSISGSSVAEFSNLKTRPRLSSSDSQNHLATERNHFTPPTSTSRNTTNSELARIDGKEDIVSSMPGPTRPIMHLEPGVLPTSRSEMPSFLHRLPTIDKKPVDLYNLFVAVMMRGGFLQVTNKKQWAKVGRELGYRGKIMTSLSSSLKACFQKSLYLFELHIVKHKPQFIKQLLSGVNHKEIEQLNSLDPAHQNTGLEINETGKRHLDPRHDPPTKRPKAASHQVVRILGSACYSRRTLSRRLSKGLFTNSPFSFDSSRPKTNHAKANVDVPPTARKIPERYEFNVTNSAQLNSMWDHMRKFDESVQDEASCKHPQKVPQTSTLRQFIDRAGRGQDAFVTLIPDLLGRSKIPGAHTDSLITEDYSHISVAEFESLYWGFAQKSGCFDQLERILDPEIFNGLSTLSHESVFCKPGNDVVSSRKREKSNADDLDEHTSTATHENFAEACAHPWNLNNVPTSPQSLLGHLDEGDVDDRSLILPNIDIATAFTTFNWHCHDQCLQSINYLAHGAPRIWYIVPELEASKFQSLVDELISASEQHLEDDMKWIAKDLERLHQHEDGSYETLLNSLDYSVEPLHEYRMQHKDPFFRELIRSNEPRVSTCQDLVITPQMLLDRGIKWTKTVQRVGEAVITYPGAYSCIISTGFSLSEKMRFASPLWLNFAMKGNKIVEQGTMPCFPLFKLISNLAQLHESQPACASPEYLSDLKSLHHLLCSDELESRSALRKYQVKEIALDERTNRDTDSLADDTLTQTFPSTVVLKNNKTLETFSVSIKTYLGLAEKGSLDHEILSAELHMGVSDDKLRAIPRGLNTQSLNHKEWVHRYQEMMQLLSKDVSLKICKTLLIEGEKISAALSSATMKAATGENVDELSLKSFKSCLSTLTEFWNDATNFIEDCQSFLSIKHHSRIRKANGPGGNKTVAHLMEIALKIPRLNFHCVEMDQILEFKLELENFDKAARAIVCKPSQSYADFDELINLGCSFGLDIPSLRFMERIRDKLKWIETFQVIDRGADPYADKKDVFLLADLYEFINLGICVLAKGDAPLMKRANEIAQTSVRFNDTMSGTLNAEYIDNLDVAQLEVMTERFGQGKLFLLPKVFAQLSRVYNHLSWIKEYQKVMSSQSRMPSTEAKHLQRSLVESKLAFNVSAFNELVDKSEEWVNQLFSRVEVVQIAMNSVMKDASSATFAGQQNSKCTDKLTLMLKQIESAYSDSDHYDRCSSFATATANSIAASEDAQPLRYCFCRGFEFGTMVECEKCTEWYHLSCVAPGKIGSIEEENFICAMCADFKEERHINETLMAQKVSLTELEGFAKSYQLLTVYPSLEGQLLLKVCDKASEAFQTTSTQVSSISADKAPTPQVLDKLRFWLRKMYGSGITDILLIEQVREAIKTLSPDARQIPLEAEPNSFEFPAKEKSVQEAGSAGFVEN